VSALVGIGLASLKPVPDLDPHRGKKLNPDTHRFQCGSETLTPVYRSVPGAVPETSAWFFHLEEAGASLGEHGGGVGVQLYRFSQQLHRLLPFALHKYPHNIIQVHAVRTGI
jgi:hypothetical protein